MTTLREAALQAREALEELQCAVYNIGGEHVTCLDYACDRADAAEEAICALRAALAEPQDKPVAWRYRPFPSWPWSLTDDGYYAGCKRDSGYAVETLYTHPAPQRQPLTDEQIMDLVRDMSIQMRWPSTPLDIARAIERAHGIGGQDEQV